MDYDETCAGTSSMAEAVLLRHASVPSAAARLVIAVMGRAADDRVIGCGSVRRSAEGFLNADNPGFCRLAHLVGLEPRFALEVLGGVTAIHGNQHAQRMRKRLAGKQPTGGGESMPDLKWVWLEGEAPQLPRDGEIVLVWGRIADSKQGAILRVLPGWRPSILDRQTLGAPDWLVLGPRRTVKTGKDVVAWARLPKGPVRAPRIAAKDDGAA